jgi:uncharacterized protein (DUF1330 family)
MAHHVIAEVTVTDDSWIPEYAANVHDLVARHGGKYLTRSGKRQTLEGPDSTPSLIALIEFPTSEAVQAFAADPEYAPFAAARQAGSESRLIVIDDTDAAGSIPYLAPSV